MFQVPTASVNIWKASVCFASYQTGRLARRSFGKLPASSRSRKLWLTSARLSYRDGFFSLRTFVSPGSNFTVVSMCIARRCDRCSYMDVYVHTYEQLVCTQELAFYEPVSPGCVRWHRQRFYLDRWDCR